MKSKSKVKIKISPEDERVVESAFYALEKMQRLNDIIHNPDIKANYMIETIRDRIDDIMYDNHPSGIL